MQRELGYTPGEWKDVLKALAHYAADKVNAPAEVQRALVERVLPTIVPEPVTATIDVDARPGENRAARNARVKLERKTYQALLITERKRAADANAAIKAGIKNCFPHVMACLTPGARRRAEQHESATLSFRRAQERLDTFMLLDILALVCGQESRRDREKAAREAAVEYLSTPQDRYRVDIDGHLGDHQKRRETFRATGALFLTLDARGRYASENNLVDVSPDDYQVVDDRVS